MSLKQSFTAHIPVESPIITITPPSFNFPPTPPLTPTEIKSDSKPIATVTPLPQIVPTAASSLEQSLHYPLVRHLGLLHPNTPTEVIHFVATRLLSRDRPHGHTGDWTPIYVGCGDLATAGVGMEAGKGCKRKDGEGKRRDEELERMYMVAKESFRLLELKSPGVDKI